MPVIPNLLERLMLLRLNRGPAPILDLFGAAGFESVALALELGLFESLARAGRPLDADELADRLDADPAGIVALSDFLAELRYLAKHGDRYRLTTTTERWLLSDSPTDLGPWFTFWNELVLPFWQGELKTAVRDGEPSRSIYEWFDDEPSRWETAQAGFRATASLLVDDVIDALTVTPSGGRLIDIGGGHGLFTMALCRRHPELSATVFDVPGAVEAVRGEVPPALAGRIDTQAGDYRTDDLGTGYDLALLFNVVHAHDPAANAALFERAAEALAPGGRLAVLDQWAGTGRTPVGRAGLQFVALTYLTTLGGTVYDADDVSSWLRTARFTEITRRPVGPVPGMAVIEAVKA